MPHAMRTLFMLALAACAAGLLGGCAKATIGKVQEVEAGTYSIGISRASGIATDMNKALSTAVDGRRVLPREGAEIHAQISRGEQCRFPLRVDGAEP
jgi:hypothetical protein